MAWARCVFFSAFLWWCQLLGISVLLQASLVCPQESEAVAFTILKEELTADTKAALGWATDDDIWRSLRQTRYRHWAELFCGKAVLSAELVEAAPESTGVSIDVLLVGLCHDILTPTGLATFILVILSLVRRGLAWWAIPCGNFIWLARGHTKRNWRRPLGNILRKDVRDANRIASRTFMLCRLCVARGIMWVIEQPMTSLLYRLPSYRRFRKQKPTAGGRPLKRLFVWLGYFGHVVQKPSVFQMCCHILEDMTSKRPPNASGKSKVWQELTLRTEGPRKGTYRVAGLKGALKETEVYPVGFAAAVAQRVAEHLRKLQLAIYYGRI